MTRLSERLCARIAQDGRSARQAGFASVTPAPRPRTATHGLTPVNRGGPTPNADNTGTRRVRPIGCVGIREGRCRDALAGPNFSSAGADGGGRSTDPTRSDSVNSRSSVALLCQSSPPIHRAKRSSPSRSNRMTRATFGPSIDGDTTLSRATSETLVSVLVSVDVGIVWHRGRKTAADRVVCPTKC